MSSFSSSLTRLSASSRSCMSSFTLAVRLASSAPTSSPFRSPRWKNDDTDEVHPKAITHAPTKINRCPGKANTRQNSHDSLDGRLDFLGATLEPLLSGSSGPSASTLKAASIRPAVTLSMRANRGKDSIAAWYCAWLTMPSCKSCFAVMRALCVTSTHRGKSRARAQMHTHTHTQRVSSSYTRIPCMTVGGPFHTQSHTWLRRRHEQHTIQTCIVHLALSPSSEARRSFWSTNCRNS